MVNTRGYSTNTLRIHSLYTLDANPSITGEHKYVAIHYGKMNCVINNRRITAQLKSLSKYICWSAFIIGRRHCANTSRVDEVWY